MTPWFTLYTTCDLMNTFERIDDDAENLTPADKRQILLQHIAQVRAKLEGSKEFTVAQMLGQFDARLEEQERDYAERKDNSVIR